MGDAPPLTAQIVAALSQLRAAREHGNPSRVKVWEAQLDRLLILVPHRPLPDIDPQLGEWLSVTPRIKLIGRAP